MDAMRMEGAALLLRLNADRIAAALALACALALGAGLGTLALPPQGMPVVH